MKIKTLAIAAATLAVGAITSQAQVYSQNIVGYVNVTLVPGYNLIANPLDDGNGNNLTNVLASAYLANKSTVQTWAGTIYNTAFTKIAGTNTTWGATTTLVPGEGFFLKNSGVTTTNTFSGALPTSGSLVTNTLNPGYNLVSSIIPYGGDLTTDTNLNLASATLANKTTLQSWNTGTQLFNTAVTKTGTGWGTNFNVIVGQGFFVKSAGSVPTNWVQTAP
jgi:hypothetical protein